ncbi:16S rRNA pseudouridine(516) synthase [uncultured Shewanella sp.]|uniref:16S rRNA pseudouridine(516) synthase n=1 Tax=uncultured Shewanella sp. TaxID=173975 RepID=UPI0026210ABD|nr:16S rRNA pseudouridine(516) synthase [uncultured Shewanella sp.]
MQSKRGRLDRFLGKMLQISIKQVQVMLAKKRVWVDGQVVTARDLPIDEFSHICVDGCALQQNLPSYIMLHKPVGVVSATRDRQHRTVIDCLTASELITNNINITDLHIVGRLDLNTSGLLLLTNDGRWSSALMSPKNKVEKVYRVTLQNPLTSDYIDAFAAGMYFAYEDITTLPVKLEILSEYVAIVTLMEGRYHQIKRMFGRFRNPVVALHRISVGKIVLDSDLPTGYYRSLTNTEIALPE